MTAHAALAQILRAAGATLDAGGVEITGADPVLPTNFLLGAAGGGALAAVGLAAADLWRLRTDRRQRVRVDLRAAAAAMRSERYVRVDDEPVALWSKVSGVYRTRDERWVQLHCNFPHHREGTLALLGCPDDPQAVAAAVAARDGAALEDALIAANLPAALVRSRAEWEAHPQHAAARALPLLEIVRLGDAPHEPLPARGDAPLGGVRVLELTRVIAGPVAGRTLAQHGAEVLRVTAPHLPDMGALEIDTGNGKLNALLDLREAEDVETLWQVVREADIVTQGYRPGALAARGFSPAALAAARPGLVVVTLSAWSHAGPWRGRRGFDSLVQATTGFVAEETRADATRPQYLPAQALDHVSGYLMAFGAMAALARRAREGGSWLVRVSLLQTAEWLWRLGRLAGEDGRLRPDPTLADVADLLQETPTEFGRVRHVAPAVGLSETPARWRRPAAPPGTHVAEWPPRGDGGA